MAEHSNQTGQAKKITLPSSIEQVMWSKKLAAAGGIVGLEVFMLYIGNNSEIQIELTDASGKGLGRFSEKTAGNRFWAPVRIPSEAHDQLFATVKLAKHGLQKKSAGLVIVPPVQIANAKWDKKEARRGDVLKLAADVKGVPDGVEAIIEVFEQDADGAHDLIARLSAPVKNKKIETEWEFEYHDDTENIPAAGETEKGYRPPSFFFRAGIAEIHADSPAIEFKDQVTIELASNDGDPVPDEAYLLLLANGEKRNGRFDTAGKAVEKDVPPGPVHVEAAGEKIDGASGKAIHIRLEPSKMNSSNSTPDQARR